MSDRGIPLTYRHVHGFGSHTFSFWNAKDERFWVKFHLRTEQGVRTLTHAEACHAIERGLPALAPLRNKGARSAQFVREALPRPRKSILNSGFNFRLLPTQTKSAQ